MAKRRNLRRGNKPSVAGPDLSERPPSIDEIDRMTLTAEDLRDAGVCPNELCEAPNVTTYTLERETGGTWGVHADGGARVANIKAEDAATLWTSITGWTPVEGDV